MDKDVGALRTHNAKSDVTENACTKSGWQDINTAPKDGTKFWGNVEDDAIAMFWHPEFAEFVSSFRRMTMAKGYTIDDKPYKDHSPVIHHPTRWMRLPDAQPGDALPVCGADSLSTTSLHQSLTSVSKKAGT